MSNDSKYFRVPQVGRIQSSKPNLQNIPTRTDEGIRVSRHFRKLRPFIEGDYAATEEIIVDAMSPDWLSDLFGFSPIDFEGEE